MRRSTPLIAALPFLTAVFLPVAVQAQVFDENHVCWSCSAASAQEVQRPMPLRRQNQRTSEVVRAVSKRPTKRSSTVVAATEKRYAPSGAALLHKVAIQVDQNDTAVMNLA